jgi:hypothetical protein
VGELKATERLKGRWTSSGSLFFDVAIIAVACFGALLGASAGFAHAVLFIGSWIGAGWVALKYAKLIEPESRSWCRAPSCLVRVHAGVFVGALIVLVMLTNALSRSIRSSPLPSPTASWARASACCAPGSAMGTAFLFYTYLGPSRCRRRSRAAPPSR